MADSADATSAEMDGWADVVVEAVVRVGDEESCASAVTEGEIIRAKKKAKSAQRDTNNLNEQFSVAVSERQCVF